MKQFVKALDKDGKCFTYIGRKFPSISDAKLMQGVFDGAQIRTLFKDPNFITRMTNVEKSAWKSFKAVATNFLENVSDNTLVKKCQETSDIRRSEPHLLSATILPCLFSSRWR